MFMMKVTGLHSIVANDFSADAVTNIHRNVLYNKLDPTKQVIPSHADARYLMTRIPTRDTHPNT